MKGESNGFQKYNSIEFVNANSYGNRNKYRNWILQVFIPDATHIIRICRSDGVHLYNDQIVEESGTFM